MVEKPQHFNQWSKLILIVRGWQIQHDFKSNILRTELWSRLCSNPEGTVKSKSYHDKTLKKLRHFLAYIL